MRLFGSFPKEIVTLYKLDGSIFNNIKTVFSDKTFAIEDTSIPIEEGDYFERVLPTGGCEYFRVVDRGYLNGGISIPAHYQTKVARATKAEMLLDVKDKSAEENLGNKQTNKPNKLFISHSTNDKEYIQAFVELLEDIGMPDGAIVCTSVPGYGIPGGERIYDWLRKQFVDCNLRVVFALSENYYDSAASLNEMGAAWVTKSADTLLILPGFDFNQIRGCVDATKIGIKLDGNKTELEYRLTELKDILLSEYSLPTISSARWERHRNTFIKAVEEIAAQKGAEADPVDESDSYVPVSTADAKMPNYISLESSFLIVYAAEDINGEILMIQTLGGTEISTAGRHFMKDNSARETARWRGALDNLVEWKWVRSVGTKGQVFRVTDLGFRMAEDLAEKMGINTAHDPLEEMKLFDE